MIVAAHKTSDGGAVMALNVVGEQRQPNSSVLTFGMVQGQERYYGFIPGEIEAAAERVGFKGEPGVRTVIAIAPGYASEDYSASASCVRVAVGLRQVMVLGKEPGRPARSAYEVSRSIYHELKHAAQGEAAQRAAAETYRRAQKFKVLGSAAVTLAWNVLELLNPYEREARQAGRLARGNRIVTRQPGALMRLLKHLV